VHAVTEQVTEAVSEREMDAEPEAVCAHDAAIPGGLSALRDDALCTVIAQAKSLLAARKLERQAQALLAIRRLAQDNDLNVQAKKRARRRGRPRKTDDNA
jgi:hypothetical protein